jgi:hypothetical protein
MLMDSCFNLELSLEEMERIGECQVLSLVMMRRMTSERIPPKDYNVA